MAFLKTKTPRIFSRIHGKSHDLWRLWRIQNNPYIYTFFYTREKMRDNYDDNYTVIICYFMLSNSRVYIYFKKIRHKCHILKKTLHYHGFRYVANFFAKNEKRHTIPQTSILRNFRVANFFWKTPQISKNNATMSKKWYKWHDFDIIEVFWFLINRPFCCILIYCFHKHNGLKKVQLSQF